MTRAALALVASIALAGCATGPDRRTVLNGMIGQSEADLVQQFGVPSRTFDVQGHHYLAYAQRRIETIPGSPFLGGYGYGGGFGYGYGGLGVGFGPEIVDRQCETTFDVVGGRVQSWTLRGNAC